MGRTAREDLHRNAVALLGPGEVDLHGAVVHTDVPREAEAVLHQVTLDAGGVVESHVDRGEAYVYSGNDDPEFGVNQHQGRTLADDAFVWECQQLCRDGTYDVVLYWAATDDHAAVLEDLRATLDDREDVDATVVGITADGVVDGDGGVVGGAREDGVADESSEGASGAASDADDAVQGGARE